eukprot:scaffold79367_cov18-Tisochrysis_lutea.AAC.1
MIVEWKELPRFPRGLALQQPIYNLVSSFILCFFHGVQWHGNVPGPTFELQSIDQEAAEHGINLPPPSPPGPMPMCCHALASEAMATIGTALGLPAHRVAPYIATHQALSGKSLFGKAPGERRSPEGVASWGKPD